MNVWQRFLAWMNREVELLNQHTWDPLTSRDPAVQRTLARQQEAAERMKFEGIALLHVEGRARWRQPVQFKAKPALVLPIRGRK
jgi:hypothetical protein